MPKHDLASVTIAEFFLHLVSDEDGAAARKTYCNEVATVAGDLASWLAVDAMLGAGDTIDTASEGPPISTERKRAFAATALVAQMSADLVRGSIALLADNNEYASSALIRQLIECEYLFRAFSLDFGLATLWMDNQPSAKHDFSPGNLRKIGGFDHVEYSNHCESGGHPRARGRHLLELDRAMSQLLQPDGRGRLEVNAMLWLDLALHCERVWTSYTALLKAEHARFNSANRVVANVGRGRKAYDEWVKVDLLAREIGPILGALTADPSTTMDTLVGGAD